MKEKSASPSLQSADGRSLVECWRLLSRRHSPGFYARVLSCTRTNIYMLETRVTSLIWLKKREERPFIPPCFNWLLPEEPFTSTNGESLSPGARLHLHSLKEKPATEETLRKPANLERFVCVSAPAVDWAPWCHLERLFFTATRSVGSALSQSWMKTEWFEQLALYGCCLFRLKALTEYWFNNYITLIYRLVCIIFQKTLPSRLELIPYLVFTKNTIKQLLLVDSVDFINISWFNLPEFKKLMLRHCNPLSDHMLT